MSNHKSRRKEALKKISKQLGDDFVIQKEETKEQEKVILELISYDENNFLYEKDKSLDEILLLCNKKQNHWINLDGLNKNIIQGIGEKFNLHYLLLEDVLNTQHQPKTDEYDDYLFLTMKMLYSIDKDKIDYEHICFVLGKNFLLSFQEKEGDIFSTVRTRINSDTGILRKRSTD